MDHSAALPPANPRRIRKTAAALLILALCLTLSGNGSHSLWDRDESRFAEATREMLESGDWIIPHFNEEIRYDKPVLIYWLMSVPMRWWGVNEFSARFPSALAGALTVLLVFLMACRMDISFPGALVAALGALNCALLFVISKAATTDATLALTVLGAMFLYWEKKRYGFSWWKHFLFWGILGLSALLKGPPGPAVVGLGIFCDKIWGWLVEKKSVADGKGISRSEQGPRRADSPIVFVLRNLAGLVFFLLITAPWAWAAWQRTSGEFFAVSIGHHVINRSRTSFEGHKGPIVYYVGLLPLLVFPMTALLLNAVRWSAGVRRDPRLRFLWSWILPGLVMFSVVKTKLPHYVAPLLPALMLLIGAWWAAMEERARGAGNNAGGVVDSSVLMPSRPWWLAGAAFMALVALLIPAALLAVFLGLVPDIKPVARYFLVPGVFLASVLIPCILFGSAHWIKFRPRRALASWLVGMFAACLLQILVTLPLLEPLRPSKPVALWMHENAPPGTEIFATIYQEPSLVFYAQPPIRMLGKTQYSQAIERLSDSGSPAALIITKDYWERWQSAYANEIPAPVRVRFQGSYYNFQKGGLLELVIVGNW